ncbi:MAG: hypothetical protein AAGF54_17325 [Pseudomonadota bacterium]
MEGAIDICLELPEEEKTAIEAITDYGWVQQSGSEARNTAIEVLYSNIFTSNHRADKLRFTYRNAGLITFSIMKNSTPISFIHESMKLSIITDRTGQDYCLLTASNAAAKTIENKLGFQFKEKEPYLKTHSFAVGALLVRVQQIDVKKFQSMKTDIPADRLEQYRTTEKRALDEVNLYIGENRWRTRD